MSIKQQLYKLFTHITVSHYTDIRGYGAIGQCQPMQNIGSNMRRVDPWCIDHPDMVACAQVQPHLVQAGTPANQKEVSKRVGYTPLINDVCIDGLVCNNDR